MCNSTLARAVAQYVLHVLAANFRTSGTDDVELVLVA
jgi:hypothetical protein